MSEIALTRQENRCWLCRERNTEAFSVGICDFCYDKVNPKVVHKHNNKIMRYKEIDFFSKTEETLPEATVLMIWLSYLTHEGSIKMWHGVLQAEINKENQLSESPFKIFERQARAVIRDYKEIYEVICCKTGS